MITWNLALLTLVAGIGGTFQFGLHISIINSPSEHIKRFMNQTWVDRHGSPFSSETVTFLWSLVVSSYSVGGFLGVLVAGELCIRYGRKRIMLWNNLVAVLGAVFMAISRTIGSFEVILLGRILYGFNAGVGLNVHNMYIGECAPQNLRGMLTVSIAFFIAAGKLAGLAFGTSEFLSSEAAWPFLMAISGIPAVFQLVTLPFFPDSPRYLLIDMEDKEGCVKAMNQLWAESDHMAEMNNMIAERNSLKQGKRRSVMDMLRDRSIRQQVIVLLVFCGSLQLIGINVGCIIDRVGRKTLLLGGFGFMNVILALLTATLTFQESYTWVPYASSVLIFLFIFSFGIGPASVVCPLAMEIFLQSYRPSAFTLSGMLNWVEMFLLGLGFPFIVQGLGSFSFLIFLAYSLSVTVFIWMCVPETRGRSMLEITDAFHQLTIRRGGARKDLERDTIAVTSTRL
ncbi:solute carrier family 2, facilitated glucose transporter member 11-like isoform X5 [Ambystoma mexicanum]|uniref:solute carrier family 2, facilitated glucose transporter member 11-like isoform X5 n=1 Tax=Ambystoma mexicanum TaxID=8296 RepID=UPI0037E7782F